MHIDRRAFLKGSAGIGAAVGFGLFDLSEARAEMRELKIARTTETRSTCPYCAVGCGVIIHTLGDKSANVRPAVVHVEGDPDHPINQGALCPKGATIKHNIVNDRRITRPMYRAPGSDKWEEKSWDFMIDRIARLLKDTRDAKLREANALTAVGVIGGCTDN